MKPWLGSDYFSASCSSPTVSRASPKSTARSNRAAASPSPVGRPWTNRPPCKPCSAHCAPSSPTCRNRNAPSPHWKTPNASNKRWKKPGSATSRYAASPGACLGRFHTPRWRGAWMDARRSALPMVTPLASGATQQTPRPAPTRRAALLRAHCGVVAYLWRITTLRSPRLALHPAGEWRGE